MIVLNGLFPVLALLLLGGCLKRLRLTNDTFLISVSIVLLL